MLQHQFYSELGKLLYAIADIDHTISKKEKQELKKLVRSELVPAEERTDLFKTDAAFYTEFEFEILEDANADPVSAFESFIDFIQDHKTAIDKNHLLAARRVASKLANVYHHKNKKEKLLLSKLNKTLNKLLKEKE